MAKTNWNKTLGEVLNHHTLEKVMEDDNTGKE